MATKVTATILAVLLVAGSAFGLYLYSQNDDVIVDNTKPTSATEKADTQVNDQQYSDEDTQTDTELETEYIVQDNNSDDNTADITTTTFTIEQIIDFTTGETAQPRVVFGSSYVHSDNYITFNSDGSFEMYLSGFPQKKTGTYTDYGDVVYVEYSDSTASEYAVSRDESGNIEHIIVKYGDYNIYFS